MITIRGVMFVIVKGLAACGLGGFILWQIAAHSGPLDGVAYVHVAASNVEVTVDDAQYHVETSWENPIVCKLSPGTHMLRMCRSGRILYEEKFELAVGQEIVLVASEPRSETSARVAPLSNAVHEPPDRSRYGRKSPRLDSK